MWFVSIAAHHIACLGLVTHDPPGRSTDMQDGPRRLPLIALGAQR